jgi:FSR family fosmidomycin resistance protein-like MFS transporter
MSKYLPRAVSLMALAHLTIELCNNFMPVVYPVLITTMGLTYTQVGLVVLVSAVGSSLLQPVFGYLSDRWGAPRMTVLSMAWIGVVMGLVGFAWSYPSLMLLVGLGALGSSAFHPAGATIASTPGSKRRGAAMSIFSVSGNIGTALSPLLVAAAIWWWGLSGTLVVLPFGLLVSLFLFRQLRATHQAESTASLNARSNHHQPGIENGALVGLALIILAVMARSWFQFALITYLPEWIRSQGGSLAAGGQILALFLLSLSVGSLTGGPLSDRIGRWQVFAVSLGLLVPVYWLFVTTTGLWQLAILAGLGILVGSTFPVGLVLAQETWPARIGLASALVMGLGWAPGGLGASVTGFIADRYSLTVGLQTLIFAPVVGVACVLLYVVLQRRAEVAKKWQVEVMKG